MTHVFETTWLPNSLSKGDRLLVPSASKHRRGLWARAQMPMWDAPHAMDAQTLEAPWWLLQKGDVLTVESLSKKHQGRSWIHVSLRSSAVAGWILSEHAYACARCQAEEKRLRAPQHRARPACLADLHLGAELLLNGTRAVVLSWDTEHLPTPKEGARVHVRHANASKDVWLAQLGIG